jgi:hypothetical protein
MKSKLIFIWKVHENETCMNNDDVLFPLLIAEFCFINFLNENCKC